MRRMLVAMALAAACGGPGEPGDDFEWPPCPEWDPVLPMEQCQIDRYKRGSWDGECWQPPDLLFKRVTARVGGEPVCLPKPETIPDAGVRPGAGSFCTTEIEGRGLSEIEERVEASCELVPSNCICGAQSIPELCFKVELVADADGSNEQLEWLWVVLPGCPAR